MAQELTKSRKHYNPLISLFLFFYLLFKKIITHFKKNEPVIKKEKYEDKYLKEFEILKMKEYSEKALKLLDRNVVEEETDKYGLIKMKYNAEKNQFLYYTEIIKTIPFNILDVVARKYVIHFDCKCIFIDIKQELMNKEKENREIAEKKALEKPKKDLDNVFANFKSYNMKEKAKAVGKGFMSILKGTLFAGLFFALAKFFSSPLYQQMIDYIFKTLIPKLQFFYDSFFGEGGGFTKE